MSVTCDCDEIIYSEIFELKVRHISLTRVLAN